MGAGVVSVWGIFWGDSWGWSWGPLHEVEENLQRNGGGGDGPESYVDHEALIIAEREAKDEVEICLILNVLVSEDLLI